MHKKKIQQFNRVYFDELTKEQRSDLIQIADESAAANLEKLEEIEIEANKLLDLLSGDSTSERQLHLRPLLVSIAAAKDLAMGIQPKKNTRKRKSN